MHGSGFVVCSLFIPLDQGPGDQTSLQQCSRDLVRNSCRNRSERQTRASDAVLVGISELHLSPHSKLSHTPGQCFCVSVNAYERETSGSLSRVAWRLIHLSYMHILHLPCVKKMEEPREHRIGDTTIPGRALEPKPEIWSPQGSRGGHSSESCCE